MKTVWKVLALVGSLLVVGFLVVAVIGFVAYRNMFPAMDKVEAADSVGKFKLRRAFPVKGNIWGNVTKYFLEYESDGGGKKNALTLSLKKFRSEAGAIEDFKETECSRADSSKEGSLKDKNGNLVGDFRYCSGTLHFRNESRSATVYTFVIGSSDYAPDSVVIDFVKSLAFNADLDFSSFAPAYPSMLTESKKNTATTSTDGSKPVFDLIKEQKRSGGSLSRYNDQELTVRGYVVSAPTNSASDDRSLLLLYDKEDILASDAVSISCWYETSERESFAKIKGRQFVTVKGVFDGSSLPKLNECRIVSVE